MNNLTGQIFGSLKVISPSTGRGPNGEIVWLCQCSCGNKTSYRSSKLLDGSRVTCGKCNSTKERSTFSKKRSRQAKGKMHFSTFPLNKQLQMIQDYCFGLNIDELSDKYQVTQWTVRDGVFFFRERLNCMHELHYMNRMEKTELDTDVIKKALRTSWILDNLADMLSPDDSEVLTQQEIMYCYLFVHTGSNEIAIVESQLDKALESSTPIRRQYLGMYLREKPNIKAYIHSLQEDKLVELKDDKRIVQRELVEQISQLKEAVAVARDSSRHRGHLLKAVELLGRTMGAFEDKIKLEEVNAASALDKLIEMAKLASAKELPDGEETEETYSQITG